MRTLFELDPEPKKARAKARKLMHVVDSGPGVDNEDMCRFECPRCGHDSGWILCKTSIAKRGLPCPKCNSVERTDQ